MTNKQEGQLKEPPSASTENQPLAATIDVDYLGRYSEVVTFGSVLCTFSPSDNWLDWMMEIDFPGAIGNEVGKLSIIASINV